MNAAEWLLILEHGAGIAVELALTIAGLTVAALVLAAIAGRRAAAARHAIWLGGLLALVAALPGIAAAHRAGLRLATIAWPGGRHVPEPVPAPVPAAVLSPRPIEPVIQAATTAVAAESGPTVAIEAPSPRELPRAPAAELSPLAADHSTEAIQPAASGSTLLIRSMMLLWLLGVAVLFARLIRGCFLLRALRRTARAIEPKLLGAAAGQARSRLGVDRLPTVAISNELTSPVALGVFRPLVVLPEGLIGRLDTEALADVLVHESAHVLRRDPLVGLLQRLAEAVYWPHPLVHVLNRRLSRAREEVCDNFVIRRGDPCRFARTLLALAEQPITARRPLGSLPLLNAAWSLEDRVSGLLDARRRTATRAGGKLVAFILVSLLATGGALAGLRIGEPAADASRNADAASRTVTGVVIDTAGLPVPGVTVRLVRDWKTTGPATTDAQGRFAIEIKTPLDSVDEPLVASKDAQNTALMGLGIHREPDDRRGPAPEPSIRLAPARRVRVKVGDAGGAPVAGAEVSAVGEHGAIAVAQTAADGRVDLLIPAEAQVHQVVALKPRSGLDYFENYTSWPPAGDRVLPEEVSLVLDGARSRSVRAVDQAGRPVAGVPCHVAVGTKKGKLSYASLAGPGAIAMTDARGIARFDWLPTRLEEPATVGLLPCGWHAGRARLTPTEGAGETVLRLTRNVVLKGRVLGPDGKPVAGIRLTAQGVSSSVVDVLDQGSGWTDAEGRYAIEVAPGFAYMVGVVDREWAARSLSGIVPRREGEDYPLPHLHLVKGTVIQGRLTRGPEKKPVADGFVSLTEYGGDPLPRDFHDFTRDGWEWLTRLVRTDRDGRYAMRVGPGRYRFLGSGEFEEMVIAEAPSITRDLDENEAYAPPTRSIRGLVRAGNTPAANVLIRAVTPKPRSEQYRAVTDATGHFELAAREGDLSFLARTTDGKSAGFATLGSRQAEVTMDLADACSASGRIVNRGGRPLANWPVSLRIVRVPDRGVKAEFFLATYSDSQGRYRFDGLVPGSFCEVMINDRDEDDPKALEGGVIQHSLVVKSGAENTFVESVFNGRPHVPVPLPEAPEKGPAESRPPTLPSGPSRTEIADLIRAINREPVSADLIDRIAAWHHPRALWARDFDRMRKVATDRAEVRRLDGLMKEVSGKPLTTVMLLRAAMRAHNGYDDMMMKQFLREWIEEDAAPAPTVRGTVLDRETGRPVPFPRVYSDDAIARSDEQGRFEIALRRKKGTRHAPGLWVEADGYASGQATLREGKELEVRLEPDVPCFGRVVDQEGKPVAGAEVKALVHQALMVLGDTKPDEFQGGSHGTFQVRTDADGRFSFQGIPDSHFARGQERILDEEILQNLKRDRTIEPANLPYRIHARDVVDGAAIDVILERRAKAQNEHGKSMERIRSERAWFHFDLERQVLRLRLEKAEIQSPEKDHLSLEADTMDFPLPLDPHYQIAKAPIYLEVTHPRYQQGRAEIQAPTRINAAPLIRLTSGFAVSGQVLDRGGKPVPDVLIQVRNTARLNYENVTYADRESGMFATPATLAPGRYLLVAQAQGLAPSWREIVVGEVVAAHQFVLEPGEYLVGKVVGPDGKPVPGAAVGWCQPIGADGKPRETLELNAMTAADADGKFRLGPLPLGEYQVTALAKAPRRSNTSRIRAGEAKIIKLAPEP